MKELTIKIVRWIFYLPLSLIGGTIAGIICKWIMPYISLVILWVCGIDYQRGTLLFDFVGAMYDAKISFIQYVIVSATIIVSLVVFGLVAGWKKLYFCCNERLTKGCSHDRKPFHHLWL